MSILQEILDWTKNLEAWQSDAVSRLLSKPILSTDDIDDLFALLKAAHGISDPKNRKAQPLSSDNIPAPIENSVHIVFHALKNLQNVNAIAEKQSLPINPSGLTVIYGDNGSGKSGYSRVLKRACRARDQAEEIYPNANIPVGNTDIATAVFEITVDGATQDVTWINGNPAPPELSALAIFDSRCARAYLDNEDDYSYVPYGLDIFEGLAKTCQQLKALVDREHTQYAVDLTAFAPLQGETAVGKLISSLSAKTTEEKIDALANLTDEELSLHTKLEKSLKENDPKEKANQLRLRSRRFSTIATNASNKLAIVNKTVITQFRGLSDSYRTAKSTAALAAEEFKEEKGLLPGTGGEVWRELFEAARRFATESHPEQKFPTFSKDAPCPLCQQPLNEGASRLIRFETFIQQDAEKNSQARRTALANLYTPFINQSLTLDLDEVTYGEIEVIDYKLAVDLREFEKSLSVRQVAIKEAIISHNWKETEQELSNPIGRLQKLIQKINLEVKTLGKVSDEKARAELQKQYNELDARIKLHQVKKAIVNAISRLGHQAKLKKCLSSLKTTSISRKASELTEKAVSNELTESLNREFKSLGVGSLQLSLQSRSNKGKALHKLKLELPQSKNPRDILSEGEQRAIAIGSFLAEVNLSGSKGGIVFDDPVSSLDHRRRELVARRLSQEAENRQVIVFTHDIYFLCLLVDGAKQFGVPINTQSLIRRPEGFGVADPELPFEGKNTRKRINALKAEQQDVAKLHKDGDEQEYRKRTIEAYFRLRLAWERAVEEVLLREVTLRFRKGVETQRLAGVIVEDEDYDRVNEGMTKCSNYAHDKAYIGGIAIPDPDELLADILTLDCWRKDIDLRAKETMERRKS